MKKKFYLFLLCSLFTPLLRAQLTNVEVYDFEVGDILYSIQTGSYPATIGTLDTIETKTYSSGIDPYFTESSAQYTPLLK